MWHGMLGHMYSRQSLKHVAPDVEANNSLTHSSKTTWWLSTLNALCSDLTTLNVESYTCLLRKVSSIFFRIFTKYQLPYKIPKMLWVLISLPDKTFSAHKCTKSFFTRSLSPPIVPSNDSNKIVMAICTNWEWKSMLCNSSTESFASLRSPTKMNPLRNDSDFLWTTRDSPTGVGPLLYEAIWVLQWLLKYIFAALTVFGTLAIALACKWETIPWW